MLDMDIAQVYCFFSLTHTDEQSFSCALVHRIDRIADEPDELAEMWMVAPSFIDKSENLTVIHIDTIVRGAHLLPIFGHQPIPPSVSFYNSLDVYRGFYVNGFADHQHLSLYHKSHHNYILVHVHPSKISQLKRHERLHFRQTIRLFCLIMPGRFGCARHAKTSYLSGNKIDLRQRKTFVKILMQVRVGLLMFLAISDIGYSYIFVYSSQVAAFPSRLDNDECCRLRAQNA